MSYWKTSKFQKLQKEWYRKLDENGFNDIERYPDTQYADTATYRDKEAREEYFRLARAYLHVAQFPSIIDEAIWYLHSEGFSTREIELVIRASKSTISETIHRYALNMVGK